ncbi:MAG: AAA family ATPase [Gemmobacter sp.]|nr:AAA family ATPase [Gemmobacter sp.]
MRFTRLRLNGFKSFVDPTELVIADGLTGVVGPNGCGKSNLLEALRWVMGENRPTAMRGGEMEDVIFAGAATRGARHFAEVAISIDNADRLAPSGFNDSDVLEVSRRITRDAGSAYRANGKEVRAKDVQMLFLDASTGAHSPALVRQGQISELINAKPRSRRRVLEEAAGISGLYQRRHEAELRLTATEANLVRVDDVLEQMAQQLATLARQARQAARYREIGAELRRTEGLLLYRRWHEADAARMEALRQLTEAIHLASAAEGSARQAGRDRQAADDRLPPLREEEAIAGALLQRLLVQRDALADQDSRAREAVETLRARITQLQRDSERESALNRDAAETIARLEWELDQLARAQDGESDRLDELADRARDAASELAVRESDLAEATEDAARLSARHQSALRMLQDAGIALEKARTEAARAESTVQVAEQGLERATEDQAEAEEAHAEALAAAEDAEAMLAEAEAARAEAQTREAEARAARSAAEGEANALRAEVAALGRLMERESQAGHQVLDLLSVEPGYEAALGAALADDLRAPEIAADAASGWVRLPDYDDTAPLPPGAAPLAPHVGAPDVLNRRLGQIGLVARTDGARLQPALRPGQRLVSLEGDLWRWDGFRAGAEDAPSAAALRLRQLNRLVQLKRDLEEVSARADGARAAHESLTARLSETNRADQMAREARRAADARVTEASRALSRAEADRSILGGRLESARLTLARTRAEAEDLAERLAEAQDTAADLPDLTEARAIVESLKSTVEAARLTMIARRSAHDEARREGEARTRRRQEVTKELSGWRLRLDTAEKRAAELADRRETAEDQLAEAAAVPAEIAARREDLAEALAAAEARRAAAQDALSAAEAALRAAQEAERTTERTAGEARETRARAEARADAAKDAAAQAAARVQDETGEAPGALLDALRVDPAAIPPADTLDLEAQRLRRAREALGAVNLRAEEDAKTVQAEHDALKAEKDDLEEAIRKLRAGIASLNREGRERLLAAFDQVNANFATLFTHLFNGGEARLVLVESDDPLEAGLEIMCQPPGKKLSTLSLLSGGEQTLTALALIFAVFLANPAPICVLDEVDAPLDDANVTRFCDLLDEMTRRTETRFLIITHHAVTMSRMDRLFGVTMQEQGVSQLVSVDLKRAEAMVA